jgi:DNA-binding transcriptional ArsR family regulator
MTATKTPRTAGARGPARGPTDLPRLARRLRLVSDPVRAHVLLLLGDGGRSVGEVRSATGGSMSALSRHLAFLRVAGLVAPEREGQRRVYGLTDAGRDVRRAVAVLVD